jgi:hypothetical protein
MAEKYLCRADDVSIVGNEIVLGEFGAGNYRDINTNTVRLKKFRRDGALIFAIVVPREYGRGGYHR